MEKNGNFWAKFKRIIFSTPALVVLSSVLTVSITLGVIFLLPRPTVRVPYSYYISEETEQAVAETDKITLDAVASNSAISIALAKDGKRLTGINFSVNVSGGSLVDTKSYYDSNGDGIIYIKNLKKGTYTVTPKSVDSPYLLTEPCEVTVVPYTPDKNILNKVDNAGKDDTGSIKYELANKNNADEKDNSAVTIQYTLPDKDADGNILYKIVSVKYGYMSPSDGESYFNINQSESFVVKQEGGNKRYNGVVIKRATIDKNLPKVKAITEVLVKSDKGSYDLYYLSAYTHKSAQVIKKGWNIIGNKRYYYISKNTYLKGWQYIGGNRYYFNSSGVLSSKKGIDVSVHQKDIDWKKVAADGIDYAIIRAAYRGYDSGKLVVDPKFEQNIKGALSNGVEVGVYVFSQAVNAAEAVEEASLLLKLCEQYRVTFPYVIDIEGANSKGTGRADKISNAARCEIINAFCATIRAGGKKPMLYTGMSYYSTKIDKRGLTDCPLWIAYYPDKSKKTVSPKTKGYNIWQYSSSGSVDGINGRVDMNAMIKREW